MELNEHNRDDEALSIIKGELSDEQLSRLKNDKELFQSVLMAQDMRAVLDREAHPIDVDEQLRKFHSKHQAYSTTGSSNRLRVWRWVACAVAAAVVAVLVVPPLWRSWSEKRQDAAFFTAETGINKNVTMESGDTDVPMALASKGPVSISMDDYQKAFAKASNDENVTLHVPAGTSSNIVLPDGSEVYLHPGSKLLFPVHFASDKRVVKLEGEGYFKVKHNTNQPFIVLTRDIETRVLGTEFNVNSKLDEVVLVSGAIQVAGRQGSNKTVLTPGKMATVKGDGSLALTDVDTTPYTYWRDGYLYFDDASLADIIQAMAENYGYQVVYRPGVDRSIHMHFFFNRKNTIHEAIDMMNEMEQVHLSLEDNKIVVNP
jgi:transmembrane sensor